MDFKVSKKEQRVYKNGLVEVLADNICDLYPIDGNDQRFVDQEIYIDGVLIKGEDRHNIIMDVEILDDEREELLDRAMFAVLKQRGADPTDPMDGIQWAEAVMGEVPPSLIVQQVSLAVQKEGPGVKVTPSTIKAGSKENLVFQVSLTNAT